jgi:hypothetical protein
VGVLVAIGAAVCAAAVVAVGMPHALVIAVGHGIAVAVAVTVAVAVAVASSGSSGSEFTMTSRGSSTNAVAVVEHVTRSAKVSVGAQADGGRACDVIRSARTYSRPMPTEEERAEMRAIDAKLDAFVKKYKG